MKYRIITLDDQTTREVDDYKLVKYDVDHYTFVNSTDEQTFRQYLLDQLEEQKGEIEEYEDENDDLKEEVENLKETLEEAESELEEFKNNHKITNLYEYFKDQLLTEISDKYNTSQIEEMIKLYETETQRTFQ